MKYLPSASVILYTPIWGIPLWYFYIPMNIFIFLPSTTDYNYSKHYLSVCPVPINFSVAVIGVSTSLKLEVPNIVIHNFLKHRLLLLWIIVTSLPIAWKMSCCFPVILISKLHCWSFSLCICILVFPWLTLLCALLVQLLFPLEPPLCCGSFSLSAIFYPTSRVPFSVHILMVVHSSGRFHVLIFHLGRFYC